MKKFFKPLLLLFISGTACMQGHAQLRCGSYNDFDAIFNNIGTFHNAQLTNVLTRFNVPGNISVYDAAVDALAECNRNFSLKAQLSYTHIAPDPVAINENLGFSKYFVNEADFREKLLSGRSQVSLTNCMQLVEGLPISDENKTMIRNISDIVQLHVNGRASDADLENSLVTLTNNWLVKNEKKQTEGSEISGCILAVGLKSCEWWREHPEARLTAAVFPGENETMAAGPHPFFNRQIIFAWPILDLAGALVGGVVSGVTQLINTGHINGGQLAISAGTSAVSASIGVVGRIANWIKNLF